MTIDNAIGRYALDVAADMVVVRRGGCITVMRPLPNYAWEVSQLVDDGSGPILVSRRVLSPSDIYETRLIDEIRGALKLTRPAPDEVEEG